MGLRERETGDEAARAIVNARPNDENFATHLVEEVTTQRHAKKYDLGEMGFAAPRILRSAFMIERDVFGVVLDNSRKLSRLRQPDLVTSSCVSSHILGSRSHPWLQ